MEGDEATLAVTGGALISDIAPMGRVARCSAEASQAEELVEDGSFEGGIVPKLLAAARAARGGLVAEIGSTAVVA